MIRKNAGKSKWEKEVRDPFLCGEILRCVREIDALFKVHQAPLDDGQAVII